MAIEIRHSKTDLEKLGNQDLSFLSLLNFISLYYADYSICFCSNNHLGYSAKAFSKIKITGKTIFIEQNLINFIAKHALLPDFLTEQSLFDDSKHGMAFKAFMDIFINRFMHLLLKAWQQNIFFGKNYFNVLHRQQHNFTLNFLTLFSKKFSPLHAKLFLKTIPTKITLQYLIKAYFNFESQILEHQGFWLPIAFNQRSFLSQEKNFNELGISFYLGQKVYSLQNHFHLIINSVSFSDFYQFITVPSKPASLHKLIKDYCGREYSFNVSFCIRKETIPWFRLQKNNQPLQLGKTSWLKYSYRTNVKFECYNQSFC